MLHQCECMCSQSALFVGNVTILNYHCILSWYQHANLLFIQDCSGLNYFLLVSYVVAFTGFLFLYLVTWDISGWLAHDPSILLRVGHTLLKLNTVEPRRARRLIFADDLFQLSKVPKQKAEGVIGKAIENLSGCKLQGYDVFLVTFLFQILFSYRPIINIIVHHHITLFDLL